MSYYLALNNKIFEILDKEMYISKLFSKIQYNFIKIKENYLKLYFREKYINLDQKI